MPPKRKASSEISAAIGDEFLPDVDLEHGNLTYTVVLGEVLGKWEVDRMK